MTDQSDWVRLAERLGSPGSGVFIHIGNDAFHVKTLTAQDLLIGRALRVTEIHGPTVRINETNTAWEIEWYDSNGEHHMKVGIASKPLAAIKLLDAVGYEHA
jgi:hypothetical protein